MITKAMQRARAHRARIEEIQQQIQQQATDNNVGLGELIHVFTDYMGIQQCAPCAQRQMKFDKIKIPDKFVWASLVNKAKALRNPEEIQITWIEKEQ